MKPRLNVTRLTLIMQRLVLHWNTERRDYTKRRYSALYANNEICSFFNVISCCVLANTFLLYDVAVIQ